MSSPDAVARGKRPPAFSKHLGRAAIGWPDLPAPVRMKRVALVAADDALRDVLVRVADAAAVEIGPAAGEKAAAGPADGEAARRLRRSGHPAPGTALSASRPDLDALERAGRYDLLAGESQLEAYAADADRGSGACALAGWIPADRVAGQPAARALAPLVQTYGTVPYADIDPTWVAGAAYVLMFGMMFGDAGEGAVLVAAALALRAGWPRWARRFRQAWLFVAGAGVAAIAFGLLYGEFFGPTGLVPALWLNPLDRPVTLLLAAAGVGAFLLAGAYALGVINRWREGGWAAALYAPSGIAGTALYLGAGLVVGGWYLRQDPMLAAGGFVAVAGLALAAAGFVAGAGGGAAGWTQAVVELFDLVVRIGSNVVSFTRLAAFGLTHAALSLLVWEGARVLWQQGGAACVAAVAVFAAGTALAFGLEALVAAVQALRLEYYELFSRVFVTQGRPFRPWHVPVVTGPDAAPTGAGEPSMEEQDT